MDQVIEKLQNADTIMEVTDLCKFFKAGLQTDFESGGPRQCVYQAR